MATYNCTGVPSDLLGAQGDFAFDNAGKFLWGPKGAASWAGTQIAIGGPPGPPGPSNLLPTMNSFGNTFGPSAAFNGQTMGTSTTGSNVAFFWPGTSIPNTFTPPFNCYLTGVSVTNYGATGQTVYFYLQDLTTNTAVYGYNAGNGIASGTIAAASYGATTYPLIAGHTYQWQGIRGSSAGATYMQINPIIAYPAGASGGLSVHPSFLVLTPTTAAKAASVATVPAGVPGQTAYYKTGVATYLYYIDLWVSGSGTCDPYIFNGTANTNQCDMYYVNNNQYITLSSTLTRYMFGPFSPSQFPFAANSYFTMNFYAPSASITVNQAFVQLTIGQ